MMQTAADRRITAIAALALTVLFVCLMLTGCAGPERLVTDTQVIEKPVPVRVVIDRPKECPERYPLDTLQAGASPVEIWRAAEAELEMRTACIVKLLAALTGESK
jgi:hypothetical protein